MTVILLCQRNSFQSLEKMIFIRSSSDILHSLVSGSLVLWSSGPLVLWSSGARGVAASWGDVSPSD